jgi:O-antigen/teichoic acid export membrane protein
MFPAVATSYRTMPERKRSLLRSGSLVIIVTTFPPCLVMAGLSHQLLAAWLGQAFAANSQSILVVLALGMFFNCVAVLPGTVTDAIGRPEVGALIMIGQALLFPPVIIWLTGRYGGEGAAVAWTLRSGANLIARLLACRMLSTSAAVAVKEVFLVTITAALTIVVCPWISWIPARVAMMVLASIAICVMACATLMDRTGILQIRQVVIGYLPSKRTRPARST